MHLGDMEVLYINSGGFGLDGGAMFGVVPQVLWELKAPPDERNRVRPYPSGISAGPPRGATW